MQSDVRDGQQNDIPLLQSMLLKLMSPKKRVDHPKRSTSKSHAHPDTTSQSVFYQSLESKAIANEERNDLDSTVRSEDDEKQPTSSSETEDGNEMVEERKSPLPIQIHAEESSGEPKEGELLEDKNNKEPCMEEHVAGAASLLNNPSQQSSAHTSHLSMSSDRYDTAQMEFKHEQLEEAFGGPLKPVGMDTSSVLTHQTVVNITSRTARSASDPVAQKPKEKRPLSAPSISDLREYENIANAMKRYSKAVVLEWEDSDMSFGGMEQENSHAKTQKKGVKNKMKNLTHKLMERLKEKRDCEQANSKSIQDSGEEEAQCVRLLPISILISKVTDL